MRPVFAKAMPLGTHVVSLLVSAWSIAAKNEEVVRPLCSLPRCFQFSMQGAIIVGDHSYTEEG